MKVYRCNECGEIFDYGSEGRFHSDLSHSDVCDCPGQVVKVDADHDLLTEFCEYMANETAYEFSLKAGHGPVCMPSIDVVISGFLAKRE